MLVYMQQCFTRNRGCVRVGVSVAILYKQGGYVCWCIGSNVVQERGLCTCWCICSDVVQARGVYVLMYTQQCCTSKGLCTCWCVRSDVV